MAKTFNKKELAWIERMQKVLDSQPETLTGFCTGIEIHFYKGSLPFNDDGNRGESVDGAEHSEKVKSKNWEAGAF